MTKINSVVVTEYQKNLKNYRRQHFSGPITKVITVLPKDDWQRWPNHLLILHLLKGGYQWIVKLLEDR